MSFIHSGGCALGFLSVGLLTGCSTDFADFATLSTDGATVLIDVNCDTDTCAGDEVSFTLELAEHLSWGDEGMYAEFLQYRVDYTLDSVEVDYFASAMSVTVAAADATTFSLALAGSDQRRTIGTLTDDVIAGEAIVTLEGYDPLNNTVQVSTTIPIQFEDIVGEAASSADDTGLF